jgi:hypothetical protein
MTRSKILLGAVALSLLSALASPASAQHVITNPGWCAQFYPNANCQNYGARKPLLELWLAASGISFPLGPSTSPPSLALTQAGEPLQALHCRESGKPRRAGNFGSIMRLGYAAGALARGDLWQGEAEGIDQPTSPGLRQHR